jgi:peptide-methionine (S)-S-oxide reductase
MPRIPGQGVEPRHRFRIGKTSSGIFSREDPFITLFIDHCHMSENIKEQTETATFAAGCFWGVEAAFRQIKGVRSTRVGYTGGTKVNPTYEEVCSGKTGHAEAVEVIFDPAVVRYDDLLMLFWQVHDPTQLNRQGPDIGSNYRSAIFYHSDDQRGRAEKSRTALQSSGAFGGRAIVTEIVPAGPFYRAEDYHQQFYEKQGRKSCRIS